MPKQIKGVNLIDNGNGTGTVEVGMFGFPVQIADLFDRTGNDDEQIKANLRLCFQIGGYAQPNSVEFKNAVNKGNNGMECRSGRVKILDCTLTDTDTQQYEVTFQYMSGPRKGQTFGMPVTVEAVQAETNDPASVIANIASWLRLDGHASLTPTAIDAVKQAEFWY